MALALKCSAPLCFAHKIFQKKKEKKRKPVVQVEGFKKASFFEKILPDRFYRIEGIELKKMFHGMVWVEIFFKTRRA
jgi:hypothetical protein